MAVTSPLSITALVLSPLLMLEGKLIKRQDQDSNLFFDVIPDKTTCETTMIQWDFFGRQAPMTLLVSNVGVPSSDATASPGPITKTLSTTITPFSGAFQWKVDVPPGTYRLNASLPSLNVVFQSGLFDVVFIPGGDLSCLETSSSVSPPSSGTPAPSSQTSPAPASSAARSPPTTTLLQSTSSVGSADDPSNTTSSQSLARAQSRWTIGMTVGAALGGAALLSIAVFLCYYMRRKRTLRKAPNRTPDANLTVAIPFTQSFENRRISVHATLVVPESPLFDNRDPFATGGIIRKPLISQNPFERPMSTTSTSPSSRTLVPSSRAISRGVEQGATAQPKALP